MTLDFLAVADIIIFFQGMLLAVLFLTNKIGNRYANVLLGLFICAQHFGLLHSFFLNSGLTAKYPNLLSIPSFFLYWTGPLLYFYTLALIQKVFIWKKKYIFYFLPALLELVGNLTLLFFGASYVIDFIGYSTFSQIMEWNSFLASGYTILMVSKALFRIRIARRENYLSKLIINWLNTVSWYFILRYTMVLFYIIGIWTNTIDIIISNWKNVLILFTTLDFLMTLSMSFVSFKLIQKIHKLQKLNTIGINLENSQHHFEELTKLMTEQRLYRKSDLKISDISVALNMNVKYVSNLVKQHTQLTITQYINKYRVDEIKIEISNRSHLLTLHGIAQECGFSSKATFNRAFKEITGMNPKDYRNLISEQS